MIYREQSNEINNGIQPSTDVSFETCSKGSLVFHDATDLQYQILLINMISHIATAVDHENIMRYSYVRGAE